MQFLSDVKKRRSFLTMLFASGELRRVVEVEIPENHLHMVVRGEPKMSPSDVMQVIKSISAREFFRRYPEIKKRCFWGGKLWTQSYFVKMIGNANEGVIRTYIQSQLTEHEKKEDRSKQLDLFQNFNPHYSIASLNAS